MRDDVVQHLVDDLRKIAQENKAMPIGHDDWDEGYHQGKAEAYSQAADWLTEVGGDAKK